VIRKVVAYKNYFLDFYQDQDEKVQLKIEYVLDMIRFEKRVSTKFFKQLQNTDGIYEARIITSFKSIRILCFFDGGDLIVLSNCFVKKTQKTPKKEIKKAEKIKTEYLKDKSS